MSEKIILTRMELLKMARELCINEYIDKRAQDHNKWLADAEVEWKTRGVNLPYPKFPPYPTEADILTRATSLNTFLSQDSENQKAIVESVDLPQPTEKQEEKTNTVDLGSQIVVEPTPQLVVPTVSAPAPTPTVETPVPTVTTVELPIMPVVTPTVIQPELLPADVWNNIASTVQAQTPAPVPAIPPLPEPVNVNSETTLSVIEQLKAKLGLK